ncbi:MAG: ParB/RepB/Spo0J family partition protein [Thermoguttaceae bacterium]|nr:ParB/RepB/Spo0J family partition protein [Thermoguttaceae bacterium]
MSKNKKLGKGLRELLEQSRAMAQAEKEEKLARDSASLAKREAEEANDETYDYSSAALNNISNEPNINNTDQNSDEDDSKFHFDSIRGDLEAAAGRIEKLHQEVGEIVSRNSGAGNNQSTKTLIDFMEPGEKSAISNENSIQDGDSDTEKIYRISVSLVDSNPWQPRETFNSKEIEELANSLKTHGLLQPIVVREFKNRYQLVAGERRFRAAMRLNWTYVPATIVDATDREMAELALIENLQRKDLNPIEKASSFEKYLKDNNATQDELSKRLNIDRSTISNFIRLLTLPDVVQQKVIDEKITQGHARALLMLNTSSDQVVMAERIEEEKLSVRQAEKVVSEWNKKPVSERRSGNIKNVEAPAAPVRKKEKSPNILDLERQLQDALDLKVRITTDVNGKGKLEIFFSSQDDFSSLMDYFRS